MFAATVLAQSVTDEGFCDGSAACWVTFVIVGAVLFGLYFFLRNVRRRSEEMYLRRRDWEDDLRARDPDLRPPEGE